MDESQFKHLAIVLCNMTDASVDWAKVAELRGIARKDNATTGFKNMMKKFDIEYTNNKFTPLDPAALLSTEPKAPKTPRTPKTSSPRKRKPKATEDDIIDGMDGSASPKKKARAKKVVETEEVKEEVKEETKAEAEETKNETDETV